MVVTAMMPWPHIVLQPSLCMNSTPACESRGHRLGQQRAVHVGVPARLEHQRLAQVIEPLHGPGALFEHGPAFGRRHALNDKPQRLACRMGIDRPDAMNHDAQRVT